MSKSVRILLALIGICLVFVMYAVQPPGVIPFLSSFALAATSVFVIYETFFLKSTR